MTEAWTIRAIPNEPDIAFAVESGSNAVADIYASSVAGVPHTEVVKRARLIAAAPELLSALDHPLLREILGFIEDAAPDEVMATLRLWQDTQRAAIAKATQP